MEGIIYMNLNDLMCELIDLDQDLLLIQLDVFFEGSKFHKQFLSLFSNKWANLIDFVDQNLDLLSDLDKPNLALHPKELAIFLEIMVAQTQIIKLLKDECIPSFEFSNHKLFADDQIEKVLCEQYKSNGLITSEYASFAKWEKIADKERISREYVDLDLSISKGKKSKYYLL